LLLSALVGGALLSLADVLARVLFAPQELPVGVLTAVLGGGYLLWRIYRDTGGRAGSGGLS
jgi:iron complex transport system permease protein